MSTNALRIEIRSRFGLIRSGFETFESDSKCVLYIIANSWRQPECQMHVNDKWIRSGTIIELGSKWVRSGFLQHSWYSYCYRSTFEADSWTIKRTFHFECATMALRMHFEFTSTAARMSFEPARMYFEPARMYFERRKNAVRTLRMPPDHTSNALRTFVDLQ